MTTLTSLGGRRNVNCSLFTILVDVFGSKAFGKNFRASSINMKEFLRGAVGADTAILQPFVVMLKAKTESRMSRKIATLFPVLYYIFCEKRARSRSA